MRWMVLICCLALATASVALADSIFDVRGSGRDVVPIAGSTRAMGGATIASKDPLDCAVMSPFASVLAGGITITAGLAQTNTTTDNLGSKERTVTTLFPTLTAIVPYKGLALMTGLYQEKEGRLTLALSGDAYDAAYKFKYRREISANSVPLYLSGQVGKRLMVSAGILFSSFDIRETQTLDFSAAERTDAEDAIDISASGRAFAGGFLVDLGRVRAAAMFRSRVDLDGALERESRYADVWQTRDMDFESAYSYRFGVRLRPYPGLALEVDYEKLPWSGIDIGDEGVQERAVYRWSGGMEYTGRFLWDTQIYPLIAGYHRQPLDWRSSLTGDIVEQVFSVGTSIHLVEGRAAVALALEFGRRKSDRLSDLHETFYGLSISVTAMEAWRREVGTRP